MILCFLTYNNIQLRWHQRPVRGVRVGGNLNNGSNAGPLNANCNNSPGNRNVNFAARLCLTTLFSVATVACLSAKHNNLNAVPVGQPNALHLVKPMKRINNLYSLIASPENVHQALYKASAGKMHKPDVQRTMCDAGKTASSIVEMLATEQFVNSPYHEFTTAASGKSRLIKVVPFYPDRIVHHCIVQVMTPVWINLFIRDTYSTIPGRGIHDGALRVQQSLRHKEETTYCLKIDIEKFYPSVNHDVLHDQNCHIIKDSKAIRLFDTIIYSTPGLPIGNFTSQWWGNQYLSWFDHWAKETLRLKHYFRYADDVVVLSPSKQHLHDVLGQFGEYLHTNLKLNIKSNYQIFPVDARGIDFLGYRFFHDYTLVRKSIVNHFKKRLQQLTGDQLARSKASYYGWFTHADATRLISKYYENETYIRR